MATTELYWWPLSAWISPGAALFVLFNFLVGAIAVTSREHSGGGPASGGRRLRRSGSSMVLDRLRSFTKFSVHRAAEYSYDTSVEAYDQQEMSRSAPEPETDAAASMSEESEEKSTISDEAAVQDQDRHQQHHASESLSQPAATAAGDELTAPVDRQRKKKPGKVAAKRSNRRARASGRLAEEAKPELNERAEMFIRQFREDLKLQRLNSIINYTRALGRSGGAAAPEAT